MTEPSHAVFLSYASQDAEAASGICAGLRAAGIEVWFDRSELRGGDVWDQKIRQQIRDCAMFVPVISANTAARGEGYFRLEWALAEQRAQRMARNRTFIVPVCVDETPEGGADVPDAFTRVQWTRLPGGRSSGPFAARISELLGGSATSAATPAATLAAAASPGAFPDSVAAPATLQRTSGAALRMGIVAAALGFIAIASLALVVWQPWRAHPQPPAATSQHAGSAVDAASNATGESVAVLPFTDMSEKHDQEYFSDGLAEELIDALTRIPNLRVPARTSSFSFKGKAVTVGEIARALGVSHILEGSVRKAGERLRITAQLVRADNGFHLWSQTYERDARDIFAVQDDIARSVSQQLQTTLLGGTHTPAPHPSTSPQAYDLYLQARSLAAADTRAGLDGAVTLFHKSLDIDPNYAPAWAWLAQCHTRRVAQGLDTGGRGYAEATAAADRAIALNPNIPEAYLSLAIARAQYERNWAAAAQALSKALALDPGNALALETAGHLSMVTGRPGETVGYFRRAVQADPLNLLHRKYLGRALAYARQPTEAAAVVRAAMAMNPRFPGLGYELGRALMMSGDGPGANAAFQSEPENGPWRQLGLPLGYFAVRDIPKARAALADLVANSAGAEFQVAEAYAYFGDADQAFEWLAKARDLHDPGVLWTRGDALFAAISHDPRYAAYLKSLDMPPESRD